MNFALTGPIGAGKSTLLSATVCLLAAKDQSFGGFVSKRVYAAGSRIGYDICSVAEGKRQPLARLKIPMNEHYEKWGSFFFYRKALDVGIALIRASLLEADWTFVDEIGCLELAGKGWAPILKELNTYKGNLILGVREGVVEQLAEHFGIACRNVLRIEPGYIPKFEELEAWIFKDVTPRTEAKLAGCRAGRTIS